MKLNKETKSKIKKISIIFGILICISVGLFFVFKALGITDIERLRQVIENCGAWGIIVYIVIRVILTLFLCVVPAISMIFDLLAVALYGATIKTFLICIISVSACSFTMYALGRFGANRLLKRIVGEKDLEKANELINEKGIVFYPLMMAVGGFPDDALVCVAGAVKMNFLFFLVSTVLGRAIGCATTVFAFELIPFNTFTTLYDWMQFASMVIVFGFVVIKAGNWLSNKINSWRAKK